MKKIIFLMIFGVLFFILFDVTANSPREPILLVKFNVYEYTTKQEIPLKRTFWKDIQPLEISILWDRKNNKLTFLNSNHVYRLNFVEEEEIVKFGKIIHNVYHYDSVDPITRQNVKVVLSFDNLVRDGYGVRIAIFGEKKSMLYFAEIER